MRKFILPLALALLAAAPLAQARSLLDGDYRIDRVVVGDTVLRPTDPVPTVNIQGDRISGFSGCNRFMGQIRYMNSNVQIGPLAGTRMACLEPSVQTLETTVLDALQAAKSFGLNQAQHAVVLRGSNGEAVTLVRESENVKVLEIAPQKVACSGVGKMECLQVRETADAPWTLLYQQIEGFEPQAGVSYRLRVREDRVANPPADAPATRLVLIETLESQ
ncbi:META and DUF4377 domain-containing protein [Andreprevotia chitinilytica]|uniref:META and DUF4377 domain-containing protein n=1 Tax=Andreprevotia chitinilytica TaxID=396808 RepID=UPI0006922F6B|nr:META and DUF4377 domain-containing protein [Andreprevotia chitinilytica]